LSLGPRAGFGSAALWAEGSQNCLQPLCESLHIPGNDDCVKNDLYAMQRTLEWMENLQLLIHK